jgi:hypothetical protein
MKRPNIQLHIEELVLHSFAPGDRYAIADAVQQELARLFAGQSVQADFASALTRYANDGRLDAGAIHLEQNAGPSSIGNQIAQAVHGGLTK